MRGAAAGIALVAVLEAWSAAAAGPPDPALAPPPQQLDERSARWESGRRRGAYVLLGSLAAACIVIALVRGKQARERRRDGSP
jgi:hypothetical protein